MARPRLPVYSNGERIFTTISFNEQNQRQKQHKHESALKKKKARRHNFTSFGNWVIKNVFQTGIWTDLEKAGWHGSSWHALTGGHPSHHRAGGGCCTLPRGKEMGQHQDLSVDNGRHQDKLSFLHRCSFNRRTFFKEKANTVAVHDNKH